MTTRPAAPADAAAIAELVGDDLALQGGRRVHVSAADARQGLGMWIESGAGQGLLTLVVTNARRLSVNNGRRLFYELSLACAREALTRGVLRGRFVLHDERLVKMVTRDFDVEAVVTGRDGDTRLPVEWTVDVDVAEQVRALERVLRG